MNEQSQFRKKLLYLFLAVAILLFGGALIYSFIEKWSYLDSLYFTTSTIAKIGYGDITPKTSTGRIFTIIYIFLAFGTLIYGISLIISRILKMKMRK